jgi:7-cyano-7-deazaguanine synthase in queuosine biosynthesis
MAKDLAIVLNNGSINSAVTTALAAQKYRPVLLHAIKGAPSDAAEETGSRARAAFEQQAAHFKPYREHTLEIPFLSQLKGTGGSKQTGSAPSPRQQTPIEALATELLPIMAAAARFASHYQVAAIYLGLRVGGNVDELAKATEYIQIWTELVQLPCGLTELEFQAPLLELEPWQVVDLGFQVATPLEKTWSCSDDGGEPCWACRGCRTRESAFTQAAKPDPLRAVRK